MKKSILSLITLSALALGAHACGVYGFGRTLDLLPILNGSDEEVAKMISELRSEGEAGLTSALNAPPAVKAHPKYFAFLDQVAKQKDAIRSGLFWYTDFDQALAAARESGRAILSLRLLGKLDEEYSCANSRLFREVLYPDRKVRKFLRSNYILHWQSVRPVPVMTIDYGDGRTLKRTITGNSAHYILDERGRVIDALPGLYTAEKFLESITAGHQFVVKHRGECSRVRPASLAKFHREKLAAVKHEFATRLERCGLTNVSAGLSDPIEMSDLKPIEWAQLAASKADELRENRAAAANNLTGAKMVMELDLIEIFVQAEVATAKLEKSRLAKLDTATAEDSVRNEFVFHRRVHERLAERANQEDIETLNKWVYAELFLMPDSDPWLGLHTPQVFTGLKDNGVVSQ